MQSSLAANGPYAEMVGQIMRDDPIGMDALYRTFSRGIKFVIQRHLGPEYAEDWTHEVVLTVVEAIRKNQLRQSECLPAFIRTIVHRRIAAGIRATIARRKIMECDDNLPSWQPSPEQALIRTELKVVAMKVLHGLPRQRDRDVLIRFYLRMQSAEQICAEMGLTETQFRLIKARAKAQYAERARRIYQRPAKQAPPRCRDIAPCAEPLSIPRRPVHHAVEPGFATP